MVRDQSVRDYKSLIRNRINEVTNLLFDQLGGSGTTRTGNMARIFLSYKNHVFQFLCTTSIQRILSQIHMNLSALLKIANSNERVNVERFRVISQNTYIMILENFPWVSVSNTLHKSLAYNFQFIEGMIISASVISQKKDLSKVIN